MAQCASKNCRPARACENHRSGTSIYRKKIDTQKVYPGTSVVGALEALRMKPQGCKGFPRQRSQRGGGILPLCGLCTWQLIPAVGAVVTVDGLFCKVHPGCNCRWRPVVWPSPTRAWRVAHFLSQGPWTPTDLATLAMIFVYF